MLGNQLATLEHHQGGHPSDAVLRGGAGALVDVEVSDLNLTDVLVRQLIDQRSDLLTRTAPDRREVDEHGILRLKDLGIEVQIVYRVYVGTSHLVSCRSVRVTK